MMYIVALGEGIGGSQYKSSRKETMIPNNYPPIVFPTQTKVQPQVTTWPESSMGISPSALDESS